MFNAIKNGIVPTLKTFGNAAVIGAGAALGVGAFRTAAQAIGEKLTKMSENSKVKSAERKAGKAAAKAAQEVAA